LLLKVLEAAGTPVAVMAAINRSLQQAVMVQDPRRLSLTIDPADTAQMASGLAKLVWLSHPSSSRTAPLCLVLTHAADNETAPLSAVAPNAAVRMLLYTPLRVVTHLELDFVNEISQADVDVLGSGMPRLRSFSIKDNPDITSLDLKALQQLEEAFIKNCANLTNLSVAGCARLTELDCQSNNLTALEVSGCTQLKVLDCDFNNSLTTLGGLVDTVALEQLSVYDCAFTSLDLTHAANLHILWLPCDEDYFTSLALHPNTQLGFLQMASPGLLASLMSSGLITSATILILARCHVGMSLIAAVPELQDLQLCNCDMPEHWVLGALPALRTLSIKSGTGLASMDASDATSLVSLKLEDVDNLKSVALPGSLEDLTCENLPELEDLDLRALPDVKVVINACPALRLRMAHLTLNP
jgi:Leucine-rich repeat (LRR) protein